MATEKQVSMFSYQIRVHRPLTKFIFPDHIIGGANVYLRDAEGWARKQDSQGISDIIGSFLDDKPETAVKQIQYLINNK